MSQTPKIAALAEDADREHCVSVKGGKVHEVTEWDDQGPDYVFPLCRTGSMTNSGTKYRKTTEALSCTNCVANRERRRARQAEEAAATPAPAVEEPAAEVAACPAHHVTDKRGAHTAALSVPRCEPGTTYGAWDEHAGGVTFAEDCAMNVANWSAEQLTEDPDIEMSVVALCREHAEQPANGCEDCAEEPADDEDAEEAPAAETEESDDGTGCSCPRGEATVYAAHHRTHCALAVEEPVRYFAEFESVKAAPGHQEMRLSIRARGEQDAAEYYALTYVPGWTAEGLCRVFGWRPVVGELEYVGMGTERGEVERTDASGTPGAMAARMAVRGEILARFTVRLATGAAGHFRAAFRLGQAYPIGWTYRVGYGEGGFFQAVTAGGALVSTAGVASREEAEEQLKAHDPAAPAADEALRTYVMELAGQKLGRAFLAARNDDLTALPDELTANAPITVQEARDRIARTHGQAEEFEPFQGEGGRFLGWTFRCGRLHSSRYGWITGRGTLTQALEPYRSVAANVLVHADRDDQETAERAAVARSMTGRKLAANRCVHHRYTRSDVQGDPVLACETRAPGETFGLFTAEGLDQTHECAVEVANEAARMGGWDTDVEGADPLPYWAKTCPIHREGVAGRCASCGQDTPDEDAGEDVQGDPLPDHGPAAHTGRRVVCSYADHTAAAREDGTADEHERTPGVIGPCPGSLLPAREHTGQPTRQDTIALSFNGPRDAWLVTGARAGDVVRYDMEELTVEDVQVDEGDPGTVYLHLGRVDGPVRFTVGERLIFARRVRKQDARCRVCNVYAVIESDTAAHGTIQSRVCGVCVEQGARSAALAAHSDAHTFTPFTRHGEDRTAGWTFCTGRGAGARYGVVTAACQVAGVGLYEYRTTAERAYLYGEDQEAGRS